MRSIRPLAALAALLLGLGIFAAPSIASADNVLVLGLRSLDGDDDFARTFTLVLRSEANQVEGWTVAERDVTLSQMLLAAGCDEPDPACLTQIGETLQIERLIYGDIRRTSSGERYDFAVSLHVFDVSSGQVQHSVADTVSGSRRDMDELRSPVRGYVAALSGAARAGSLVVSVNVPGAEVFLDGQLVGVAEDGTLTVEGVETGNRRIRIVASGHQTLQSSVAIEAFQEASFEAQLERGLDPIGGGTGEELNVDLIVGVSLLAVAAGMAVGWIYSMAAIKDIENNPDYQSYLNRELPDGSGPFTPGDPNNVCAEASGTPSSLANFCSDGQMFEALQFVFLGIGAVAAGVGAYFLYTGLSGSDEDSDRVSLELLPSLGMQGGSLSARLRF